MRELLSINLLFVGQLYKDISLALHAHDLIFLQLTPNSELLLNNSLLELIYFLNIVQDMLLTLSVIMQNIFGSSPNFH